MPSENGDVIKNDRAPSAHLTVSIQIGGQTLSCALYKSAITTEFYFCFWDYVAIPLKDCLNDAYQCGEMSISQKRE